MTESTEGLPAEMVDEYFRKLRFSSSHHQGLGDIRLTMGQQDEIVELLREHDLSKRLERAQSENDSLRHFIEDRIMDDKGWQIEYEAFLDELKEREI